MDLVFSTQTADEDYGEDFHEGKFQSIWRMSFLRNWGFNKKVEGDLERAIAKAKSLKIPIIEDKYGNIGAEVWDDADGEYRIKRAKKVSARLVGSEEFDSKSAF